MLARTIITAMLSIILMLGAVGSSAAQEKSDPRAKTGGRKHWKIYWRVSRAKI